MAAKYKKILIARIKSLAEDPNITIVVSPKEATVDVQHKNKHVPNMLFVWSRDHYIGYMLNAKGRKSHAIMSLWSPLEANQFTVWYLMLISISAKRLDPQV